MHQVTTLACLPDDAMERFLAAHGIALTRVADGADIPASYWGAPEAGVIGDTLYARGDTPVHSLLHTACHVLCMGDERRAALHTDCGGTDIEEAAVCYLQCLLADALAGYSRDRLFADMDAWGYSFRLGSARAWFENDADDARAHLEDAPLPDGTRNHLPGLRFS
ncbi:hypothetical protein [Algiphilus sp.]|uniref:hypothetical protein n=1 Tax=Algiphilus sp. TaxID=1872431 RepID=UPI003C519AED